jgi:hypothetical protein
MSRGEIVSRCAALAAGVTGWVWGVVLSTGKGLCGFRRQFTGKAVRPDFTRFQPVLRVDAVALFAYYKTNNKIF